MHRDLPHRTYAHTVHHLPGACAASQLADSGASSLPTVLPSQVMGGTGATLFSLFLVLKDDQHYLAPGPKNVPDSPQPELGEIKAKTGPDGELEITVNDLPVTASPRRQRRRPEPEPEPEQQEELSLSPVPAAERSGFVTPAPQQR